MAAGRGKGIIKQHRCTIKSQLHNLFSYTVGELNESPAELVVVSFNCGLPVFTLCVLAANHVVELWCSH